MGVATAHAVALAGALGHLIDVQVDVSAGQVAVHLVGRPDQALNESPHRVKMAIVNSGFTWPATRRVTILLTPADLPKAGTHFDLGIAVAICAAAADDVQLPAAALAHTAFIGELTLTGGLRSVPGVLPMVLAARERGCRRVFVPEPQAAEAAMVPGMEVFGMRSLAQVIAELRGSEVPSAPEVAPMSGTRLLAWRGEDRREQVDLADLDGMREAKFALEVAAAGGHHMMLIGPKGAGKTTLAERLPTLLPDLSAEEAMELTALHSLAGALEPGDELLRRPPFCAPHHDASKTSLIGGGTGRVRPGELSRAHNGVLFLDEFPLFHADVIQALRQPLEGGEITVARGNETATFPCRGIVIIAANPCPCGDYSTEPGSNRCQCREVQRRDYRHKLEGPVADRIDIRREIRPLTLAEARDPLAIRESSSEVRERVQAARERQTRRFQGRGWRLNAQTPGHALRDEWPLTDRARGLLDEVVWAGQLTHRGAVRTHRLAWTIADLHEVEQPGPAELDIALRLRRGDSLMASQVNSQLRRVS